MHALTYAPVAIMYTSRARDPRSRMRGHEIRSILSSSTGFFLFLVYKEKTTHIRTIVHPIRSTRWLIWRDPWITYVLLYTRKILQRGGTISTGKINSVPSRADPSSSTSTLSSVKQLTAVKNNNNRKSLRGSMFVVVPACWMHAAG
jgi:hypothetical protein